MSKRTRKTKSTKRNRKSAPKKAHALKSNVDLGEDFEIDRKRLYSLDEVTDEILEHAKGEKKKRTGIMYPCPQCSEDSGYTIGLPLWVNRPATMTWRCLAGHEGMVRVFSPLITETGWAPRVSIYVRDAVIPEGTPEWDQAMADIEHLKAEQEKAEQTPPLAFVRSPDQEHA